MNFYGFVDALAWTSPDAPLNRKDVEPLVEGRIMKIPCMSPPRGTLGVTIQALVRSHPDGFCWVKSYGFSPVNREIVRADFYYILEGSCWTRCRVSNKKVQSFLKKLEETP
jgi:hypothetical protein